jgi:hypothetical protein
VSRKESLPLPLMVTVPLCWALAPASGRRMRTAAWRLVQLPQAMPVVCVFVAGGHAGADETLRILVEEGVEVETLV